jgi:CHAD domain-containing protein
MAYKSATTKQQDTSQPRTNLIATAEAFNAAVTQCVEDAAPEAVHGLRTGSRRLQAMLEAMLREDAAVSLQQPARGWLRQLKQIRRAAGTVRDLDVHRKLLEHWIANENSPLEKQAGVLDAWLKGRRKHLASDMQKKIGKRKQELEQRQASFLAALDSVPLGRVRVPRSADAVALEQFVRAADAMPSLDAENLHDFRKATKKARYVAESGSQGQEYSSVAKALKRVQDSIGDWHDWVCLSQEGAAALGKGDTELTASLEREVDCHFSTALRTTQTIRGRLLGEWMAGHGKRPPTSVRLGDGGIASGRVKEIVRISGVS